MNLLGTWIKKFSKIDIYLSSLPEKRRYSAYHRDITVPDWMFGLFFAARPPRGDARLGEAGARVARARDSGGSHGDTVASVTSADTFACQTCAVTRPIKVCLETESVLASYRIQLFYTVTCDCIFVADKSMCIANSQKLVMHCLYKEQKYRNCISKNIIIIYF